MTIFYFKCHSIINLHFCELFATSFWYYLNFLLGVHETFRFFFFFFGIFWLLACEQNLTHLMKCEEGAEPGESSDQRIA